NGKIVIKEDTKRVNEIEYLKHAKPLNERTLLLGINGTIGNVAYYKNEKCMLGKSACYINLNDAVDLNFIYYALISKDFQNYIEGIATGTTIPNVPLKGLREYTFKIPALPEQKSIASILSSLDDKIDLLHRQNATLEKMAETLFRQWFVERRPEPVEGEAKEEWEEETFEKWIHETVGGDWGKESIKGDFTKAVCCLRGTDIADLNNGLPNKTPIRFIKENKYQSICPNDGDLIIEVSGGTENQSTGRICYINNQVKTLFNYPLVFSNFCRMIRIKKPEYSFFVYCYIQYLYNQDEFFNLENGSSGIKNLDYKTLLFDLKYKMPDEDSVIKFHNHVKSLFQKVNQNKIQIRTLSTLRDTLLPKLMSGEVTVQE
ncbi:MAG: type restriction enzyme subunit, partial [Bacteroidota bacterium]|nr:type restriction enzyme subunit [Bacteroidota bacterium]